jgi:hypothetical protein
MTALSRQAADVRISEVALGTTIAQNSSATAAIVVVSDQGPIVPTFYDNYDTFAADFGSARSYLSFDGFAARDYFKEGNSMWAVRAVTSSTVDADRTKYGVINVGIGGSDAANPYVLNSYAYASADPFEESFDVSNDGSTQWSEAVFGALGKPLYSFFYKKGPGSISANIAIKIKAKNLEAPSRVGVTLSNTGGTLLGSTTYRYRIAAFNELNQVFSVTTKSFSTTSGADTKKNTLNWDAVPGAAGYVIYGRSGTLTNYTLAVVGGGTLSWADDGSAAEDSTGALFPNYPNTFTTLPQDSSLPVNSKFKLEIYDTSKSTLTPVEAFDCSIIEETDASGLTMETAQRINVYSKYLRCISNVPTYASAAALRMYSSTNWTINTAGTKYINLSLGAGQSGVAPTASEILSTWDVFGNKEEYIIDVMINSGRAIPAIQKEMDLVASTRGDCVAFLDTPSVAQDAQTVLDYRNIDLNLNSSYSALFASDVLESDATAGKVLYVPPSGIMASLLARTSRVSYPYRSIAGLNRGLLDVLGIRNAYEDTDATRLARANINYARKFLGKGIPLWEQWTLSSAPNALQFLNVRVLCNVLKRSMYEYLLYSEQEPSDETLQKAVKYGLEKYLDFVKGTRGITAYRVLCNSVNNPSSVVNTGTLRIAVTIVATLAVRAIELTLIVSEDGLSLSENEVAALSI